MGREYLSRAALVSLLTFTGCRGLVPDHPANQTPRSPATLTADERLKKANELADLEATAHKYLNPEYSRGMRVEQAEFLGRDLLYPGIFGDTYELHLGRGEAQEFYFGLHYDKDRLDFLTIYTDEINTPAISSIGAGASPAEIALKMYRLPDASPEFLAHEIDVGRGERIMTARIPKVKSQDGKTEYKFYMNDRGLSVLDVWPGNP